ncbi:MAG: carbohydrate binding family 9 domain-containing protein [Acidobacteria bacterium]|nr:carbohydrate binding family 9 domain-containing protein [Acidobacteriota bacterium]
MTRALRHVGRFVAALACVLGAGHDVLAQAPAPESGGRRTMVAEPLADGESVQLDGRLDEPVWARAQPAADFVQVDPANGRPATEPTEVRVAFDADSFYMGVICFDSEPERSIATQLRRDETLPADDKFRWTIDTFLDARTGYFFEMNPLGAMSDALLGINGQNRQWDGIWNARARRTESGWVLEIRIPFRTLNFNPNNDTWGINFDRTVQRKNETTIWSGWARNQGLQRMTNAGLVTGIRNVTQGRGLDIKPYGLVTTQASPGRGTQSFDSDASAGLDLFYNPTPLVRAVLTVNTDFAQTEVDQRQVNLTRYSLFFPEKRDFFLDGVNFFDFASPANADLRINPFFSRRIGLSAASTPQPIDFGTKLTGQVGRQDVGLLHVRTGAEDALAGEDFTVARLKRRVLRQSYVGVMYTRRDPRVADVDTRHTLGVDSRFATSSFLGSQNLEATAWLLHAPRPDTSSGHNAFGGTLNYPNDRWTARLDVAAVQERFDPSVGFVTRRGYRRYTPGLGFAPRPDGHRYIRQLSFGAAVDVQTDVENRLLTRSLDFELIRVNLHSADNVTVAMRRGYERLDAPFTPSPGITLPTGAAYEVTRYRISGQTANRRVIAVNGRYEAGGFYSGTRAERALNVSVRARPGLIVYLAGEWNDVTLREGRFATRLYRVVGETQFTPFVALVNNVQYDTQSAVLGWQSRLRWIITPGNDLYVVYTHNWLDEPLLDRFATLDKRAASKIFYTYRF